jgi:hypothetical protein
MILGTWLLVLLAGGVAWAEPVVPVYWKVRYLRADKVVAASLPPAAYLERLKKCGHTPDLSAKENFVRISVLRCQGILDFSHSSQMKGRIRAILKIVSSNGYASVEGIPLRRLKQGLSRLDFAVSPHGVFHSQARGERDARFMAINISEDRLVIVNQAFWAQYESGADSETILVHEALGAMGVEDDDYQLSSAIISMSKKRGLDFGASDDKKRVRTADGGSSVVGRGGDSNEILLKASLLRLVEKKLEVSGVDPRYVPTKTELRQAIKVAPLLILPRSVLARGNLCDLGDGSRGSHLLACGQYLLDDGTTGKPVIAVPREWFEYSEVDKHPLLVKIYRQIVTQLTLRKIGQI